MHPNVRKQPDKAVSSCSAARHPSDPVGGRPAAKPPAPYDVHQPAPFELPQGPPHGTRACPDPSGNVALPRAGDAVRLAFDKTECGGREARGANGCQSQGSKVSRDDPILIPSFYMCAALVVFGRQGAARDARWSFAQGFQYGGMPELVMLIVPKAQGLMTGRGFYASTLASFQLPRISAGSGACSRLSPSQRCRGAFDQTQAR